MLPIGATTTTTTTTQQSLASSSPYTRAIARSTAKFGVDKAMAELHNATAVRGMLEEEEFLDSWQIFTSATELLLVVYHLRPSLLPVSVSSIFGAFHLLLFLFSIKSFFLHG